MTVIELPDEQAARLEARAQARGLTVVEGIGELAGFVAPRRISRLTNSRSGR